MSIIITITNQKNFLFVDGSKHLRLLLSFSVGGMLGDVFLHVLPEVWLSSKGMFHYNCFFFLLFCIDLNLFVFKDTHGNWIRDGGWVLTGLLVFFVVEKLFSISDDEETIETFDRKVSTKINSINNNKAFAKLTKCNDNMAVKAKSQIRVSYI